MKISDLNYGRITTLEVQRPQGEPFTGLLSPGVEVALVRSQGLADTLLRVGDRSWSIAGIGPAHEQFLEELFTQNLPRIVWLAASQPRGSAPVSLALKVHTFARFFSWPQQTDMGIDETIVGDIRNRYLPQERSLTPDRAAQWLADQTLLPGEPGRPPRGFVSAGPKPSSQIAPRAFRLHGRNVAVDVRLEGDGRLLVSRLTQVRSSRKAASDDERYPVLLAEAPLRFCDQTVAGRFRGEAQTQLDQLVRQAGSYLELWRQFNELEAKNIAELNRGIGAFAYHSRKDLGNGQFLFHLTDEKGIDDRLTDLLSLADQRPEDKTALEATAEFPERLRSPLPGSPETPPEGPIKPPKPRGQREPRPFRGSCRAGGVHLAARTVRLKAAREREGEEATLPPAEGFLFLSDAGDRARLERRKDAHEHIARATCPMPQLGLLLENQPVPMARQRTIEPMSSRARRLFKQDPTPRQVEAIKCALNTPDIALIQGPPGTGKTTVITALLARLAELADANEGVSGMILLSSFQHDAVENAASRTVVYGVPAMKHGARQGTDDRPAERVSGAWAERRKDRVRELLLELTDRSPVRQVFQVAQARVFQYLNDPPEPAQTAALLEEIRERIEGYVPERFRDDLQAWSLRLRRGRATDGDQEERLQLALRAVKGLRIEERSFADDGPLKAGMALRRLDGLGVLDDAGRQLLELARDWSGSGAPPFLGDIALLKEKLDEALVAADQTSAAPRAIAEVEQLLTEVLAALDGQMRQSQDGVATALAEYLNDLENDPQGVELALSRCTAVLAATCQGAAGSAIRFYKRAEDGHQPVYDTVVIDEAARANPMDLLIPMAQARRRIILVGDHRQLPHILDQELFRQLESSASDKTREVLETSLFERLFKMLREREAADGVCRVVTLDKQYRMHPELGAFVSQHFYVPFREGFESPRPETDFAHDLPGYAGKVAAWLEVSMTDGRESGGQSKSRRVEARRIAGELRTLITASPTLTFGVIGFYSAQVPVLCEELCQVGLMDRDDDGRFRVAKEYREVEDDRGEKLERLRVGTVDAFQGKEFDVVFLSMTRSNNFPATDAESRKKKYGFLMLPNRLCVAMSRQMRLLIVAGDPGMVLTRGADEAVPALKAFHDLCGGPYGVRVH